MAARSQNGPADNMVNMGQIAALMAHECPTFGEPVNATGKGGESEKGKGGLKSHLHTKHG